MLELIGLVGITLIIVRGTIFGPVRRLWPALLGCAQCTGTWIGAAAGGAGLLPLGHGAVLDAVFLSGATSVSSLAVDAVLIHLLGDPKEADPCDES